MSEHYRVMISLIHVKTESDQPELYSCSLPGSRSLEVTKQLLWQILKIAHVVQNPDYSVDRIRLDRL